MYNTQNMWNARTMSNIVRNTVKSGPYPRPIQSENLDASSVICTLRSFPYSWSLIHSTDLGTHPVLSSQN